MHQRHGTYGPHLESVYVSTHSLGEGRMVRPCLSKPLFDLAPFARKAIDRLRCNPVDAPPRGQPQLGGRKCCQLVLSLCDPLPPFHASHSQYQHVRVCDSQDCDPEPMVYCYVRYGGVCVCVCNAFSGKGGLLRSVVSSSDCDRIPCIVCQIIYLSSFLNPMTLSINTKRNDSKTTAEASARW